jgi:Glycosyl hydrolase catalytic core
VLLISILVVCGSSSARAQNLHYGMNTLELTPPMADKMVELGAGVVRLAYGWDVIEGRCKGCFDWTTTDAWRDEARRTGRTIFASLAYAPSWANGGQPYHYPPLNYQDWYDFVYAVASRYRDDIFLWGVWNEPDLDGFLKGADLRVYRSLAIAARAAILAANARALVLGPEVSHLSLKSGWFAAAMADYGDLFDIVTVHWYVDGPALDFMMDRLVRPWTRGHPIWLSEVGMTPCASLYGEIGQTMFYDRVLAAFQPRREWWTAVLFYDLYELPKPHSCGGAITRADWSNRPAFTLLQQFIAANP